MSSLPSLSNRTIILVVLLFLHLRHHFKFVDVSASNGIYHVISKNHPNLTFSNFVQHFCRPHFRSKQFEICRKHNALMISIVSGYKQALIHCRQLFKHNKWNCAGHNVTVADPKDYAHRRSRDVSTIKNRFRASNEYDGGGGGRITRRSYMDQLTRKPVMEAAFVHALSSASIAHYITQTCSQGKLNSCGCDHTAANNAPVPNWSKVQLEYQTDPNAPGIPLKLTPSLNRQLLSSAGPKSYTWSGCSDNVHFGTAFARDFVLAPYLSILRKRIDFNKNSKGSHEVSLLKKKQKRLTRKQKQALVHMHNLNVGTQILSESMTVRCKCHGVSGSCDTKTCWRALPKIENVAQQLYRKYADAVRVRISLNPRILVPYYDPVIRKRSTMEKYFPSASYNNNNYPPYFKTHRNNRVTRTIESVASKSLLKRLVYSKGSPTFCQHNVKFGSLGTYGRSCNVTKDSPNSCLDICCTRGFMSRRQTIIVDCKCKFIWCCEVKCQKCPKVVEIAKCH